MEVANTLAYYNMATKLAVNSFIVKAPSFNTPAYFVAAALVA
jgi:hypothetical protein